MNNSFLDFYKYYSDRSSITPNGVNNGNKIKKIFNREYRTLNCLGKGGFGQVFDGRRRSDNSPVVIKFLPKDRILNWGTFEGVCNQFFIFLLKFIKTNKTLSIETCTI
jgi:serine/threonine protein kinase